MRSNRMVMRFGLICLLLCCCAVPSAAQGGGAPFIHIETHQRVPGTSPGGTVLVKVWFVATKEKLEPDAFPTEDQLWSGDITQHHDQLLWRYRPLDIVRASATPASDLAFLFAVDVSGSMAGPQYDDKLRAVCGALRRFVSENSGSPHVYVRLVPFGHDVPYDVPIQWEQLGAGDWRREYISLTPGGAARLGRAIDDIESFGRSLLIGNVDTALYAAFIYGVGDLMDLPPHLAALMPKPVLVLLTDGQNDLLNNPGNQNASLTLQDVMNTLMPESKEAQQQIPRVHTIGFDLGASALGQMRDIRDISPRVHFTEVQSLDEATEQLYKVYGEIFSWEGKSGWLEFDTGCTDAWIKEYGFPLGTRGDVTDPAVMVLVPSPIASSSEWRETWRIFGVAAVTILIVGLLLFFAALRGSRLAGDVADLSGGDRGESLGDTETTEPMESNVVSLQEWERRKRLSPASVLDETRVLEDDTE